MKTSLSIMDVALKSLRQQKGRTILTILTVGLSVSLMFIVLTYIHSDNERQKRMAINEIGAYHAQYERVSPQQISTIQTNKSIKKDYIASIPDDITFAEWNDMKVWMTVLYSEGINDGLIALKKGRPPDALDEIVLDGWVLNELGLEHKIGQTVSLTMQTIGNSNKTVHNQSFKLVGIIDDIAVRKAARAGLMLVSKSFIEKYSSDNRNTLFVLLQSDYNASGTVKKIGKAAGLENDQIKINEKYTQAFESDIQSIMNGVILVLFIVMIAGIVIYNIFNIYISQKIRLFGVLKAIGMTSGQLRVLIYIEGLLIALCGSIIGTVGGIGSSIAFVPFLGEISTMESALYVHYSPLITGGTFVLGVLMVMVSVSVPARKVSKISEIAAIKYNPTTISSKKVKRTSTGNRISLLTLVMASFSRNKKRMGITVLSITLTGLVFLSASSLLSSINIGNMASSMVPGDYKLSSVAALRVDRQSNPLDEPVLMQVQSLEGLHTFFTEMYDVLIYNREDATRHVVVEHDSSDNKRPLNVDIYGYNDALMGLTINSLDQGTVSLGELKNGNFLIAVTDNNHHYQVGDKVRLASYDSREEREYTIAGTVPSYVTYKGSASAGGILIAHQQLFERMALDQRVKQVTVDVDADQEMMAEQALQKIGAKDKRIELSTFREIFTEYNGLKKIMELAAYSFCAVLMLISMFNLANSTITNLLSRNREISMMEAVGLSQRQLICQLLSEGLIVIGISLLIIFALGIPSGYFAVEIYRREASFAVYHFPAFPVLILTVVYIITQVAVILLMQRSMHKASLIERIRFGE
ncbi:ABC transporter permease [Paenibacillus alvei]|uniref:ABC3 transporter permease C-terminal domain-containing protein n=1 Tax=Paenibacillus alvei TaxID=44250 RepID=A0A383RKB6_PAEAL|nr:ABC transporter permease [Paenibacillus alvei]SYX87465.1 conserved membrane protein of unknown function [Paenibacillus alvei]